jgi:DNA primase
MEIPEIKAQLTIAQVLDHYNLGPDKNNMLRCPFHTDRTPSLQIYPQTNTFCCFSSNCKAGTGDVIEFIRLMEKSDKHQAILKAKSLLGHVETKAARPEELGRAAILARYLEGCRKGIANGERARVYATQRGLDWQALKLGFTGDKVPEAWGKEFKESAAAIGLVGKTADGRYLNRFKNCLVFTMQNAQGHAVGIYGRNLDQGHYYLPGPHQGLYPGYPNANTKKIILTEAIIDAATLHQHAAITNEYTVLACYGANGFTQEHEQAIRELKQLEEVVLFFDGDGAGREGIKKVAAKLQELRKDITISSVATPENEDVNSLAQAHKKEIFAHLIEKRAVLFSPDNNRDENKTTATPTNSYKLEIFPHRFLYRTATANYHIKGDLQNNFESLRVSLDIEHPTNGRKSRSKVDLYEDKQVEKAAREAAEKLQIRADLVQLDLESLTELLEQHRESTYAKAPVDKEEIKINPLYEKQAIDFLSKPNLIKRWNELIGKAGVVGEENNRIMLMVIAASYKMEDTLHALIQGSSGSGKTHLMTKIFNLLPEGIKKKFTRLTEGNLYNWGEHELSHTVLCIEDLDSLEEKVLLALRELISSGALSSGTSIKNESTNGISSVQKLVYGPVASMCCTTKGEVYEDNMGRCFVIAVDEGKEQTLRIIEYQNKKAAGLIDEAKEKQCTEFIQTLVSLLKSYDVINPYADKVRLPEEAHKIRRLNGLYQSLVKAVTVLHQFQRKKDARGRLISELEDLKIAAEIMFESIVLKVDELDGSLRQFYERLKAYVKTKGNGHPSGDGRGHETYEFGQREARQALNISRAQLQRYINDLVQLEYIRQSGGHINRGFNYKVLYWDNIQALRGKVKRHLQGQLDRLELETH